MPCRDRTRQRPSDAQRVEQFGTSPGDITRAHRDDHIALADHGAQGGRGVPPRAGPVQHPRDEAVADEGRRDAGLRRFTRTVDIAQQEDVGGAERVGEIDLQIARA